MASWNVLSDAYTDPAYFPRTPPEVLAPGARTAAVLNTADALDAHVLLFQEADPTLVAAATTRWPRSAVLWCPKGKNRPDGCLTVVHPPWTVTGTRRIEYTDTDPATPGGPPSGHVLQTTTVTGPDGTRAMALTTHMRYAPPGTSADRHVGVRQAHELVRALDLAPAGIPVVLGADTNDPPEGPVRRALRAAGLRETHPTGPRSYANGTAHDLDVLSVRGTTARPVPTGLAVSPGMPDGPVPSDHLPLVADVDLPA